MPTVVVLAESNLSTKTAEKSGVIRVKEYHQSLIIQSDGMLGTKGKTGLLAMTPGSIPMLLLLFLILRGYLITMPGIQLNGI